MSLTEVYQLPAQEIAIWEAVFIEEYYQLHPDKRPLTKDQHMELLRSKLESKNNKVLIKYKKKKKQNK